jgi:DNA invertase Pin-like site-specific DNA recombinase
MISARTMAALVAAKKRGMQLGRQRRKVLGTDWTGNKTYGSIASATAKARAKGSAAITKLATDRALNISPPSKSYSTRRHVAEGHCSRA